MSLSSGARLGPYEVVEPIGRGAMGEVYRARDTRLGRDVAIKVLPEHTAHPPDALARFEFEARAVAGLNHPNILALHDVGVESGLSYAVTELLEGDTVRDRLHRDGVLPPRRALDLATQFARGLAAAHGRGIVHRDLKPENLFVTADGRLKILDFGVAVHDASSQAGAAAETRFATEAGLLVGTVAYMAPEQVRGEPASIRSDIFSFGLVVYEILTGSNPFKRETMPETIAAILRDQPEPLASVPGIPPVAARIIDRCLEKRADDRPQSMHDVALFLEAASAHVREPELPARPDVNIRRIAIWNLAGICALLILITTAMWGYLRATSDRAAAAAVAADLARAETLVLRAQQDRLDRLRSSARLVASFPQLKALFETDAPTIRDFLQSYQQRNPGTPLLVALRPDGYVLARTDEQADDLAVNGQEWLATLLSAGGAGVIIVTGRPYHAAISSAEASGTIFGSVIAAAPVDNTFAQVLREVTEQEAILLDTRGIAGTSLRSGQVPWQSLEAFRALHGSSGSAHDVTIGAVRFTAREVLLTREPPVAAVVLASRDETTEAYRGIETGLWRIGLAAVGLVLIGGLVAFRHWIR